MNTYAFPLGTDHVDYDATRVAADLRAQRGAGGTSPNRSRRRSFAAVLGFRSGHSTPRADQSAH